MTTVSRPPNESLPPAELLSSVGIIEAQLRQLSDLVARKTLEIRELRAENRLLWDLLLCDDRGKVPLFD